MHKNIALNSNLAIGATSASFYKKEDLASAPYVESPTV